MERTASKGFKGLLAQWWTPESIIDSRAPIGWTSGTRPLRWPSTAPTLQATGTVVIRRVVVPLQRTRSLHPLGCQRPGCLPPSRRGEGVLKPAYFSIGRGCRVRNLGCTRPSASAAHSFSAFRPLGRLRCSSVAGRVLHGLSSPRIGSRAIRSSPSEKRHGQENPARHRPPRCPPG